MLELLQTTPDVITQVADSTGLISEPMRALLDSISVKTGQTAMNTARDNVDWEVIQITRKEYYFAIATIILALISLVVDIATTIFQHISSKNSEVLSSKYSIEVQQSIAIDMAAEFYHKSMELITLYETLSKENFKSYPLESFFIGFQVENNLDLEALCLKDTKLIIDYNYLKSSIKGYNNDVKYVLDYLKSKSIDNEIKKLEMESLINDCMRLAERIILTLNSLAPQKDRSDFCNSALNYIFRFVQEEYDPNIHSTDDVPMDKLRLALSHITTLLPYTKGGMTEGDFYDKSVKYYSIVNSYRYFFIPIE